MAPPPPGFGCWTKERDNGRNVLLDPRCVSIALRAASASREGASVIDITPGAYLAFLVESVAASRARLKPCRPRRYGRSAESSAHRNDQGGVLRVAPSGS